MREYFVTVQDEDIPILSYEIKNGKVIKENNYRDFLDEITSILARKYVDSYKKDYGVDVSGKVVVTMNVELLGIDEESKSNITKTNDLQITIPLTKNATEISIDTNNYVPMDGVYVENIYVNTYLYYIL